MPISYKTLQHRKTNNLCDRCGVPNAEGKKLCQKHLDQAAIRTTKRRNRAIEKGFCNRCIKKEALEGFSTCETCREYNKKHSKKNNDIRYKHRKDNNLCTACGIGLDIDDGVRCKRCALIDRQQNQVIKDQRRKNHICTICGKNPIQLGGKTYCEDCSKNRSEWYATSGTKEKNKEERTQWKNTVLEYYGKICKCCGESTLEFLSIDHIEGSGNQHRKEINKYGSGFYKWVIDNNFPEDLQTLCMNCNFGKRINGGTCPHQQKGNE